MINVNQENLISSRALGKLIGVTDERVRQLEDEGVFESQVKGGRKYFDLTTAINAYVTHLKELISGKANGNITEEIAKATLRYKTAQAGKAELELEELKGTMHRAEDIEILTADMIAGLRAEVLALPGRLAVDTANASDPKETSALLKAGVDEALNNMARYKYNAAEYRKKVRERQKWSTQEEEPVTPRRSASSKGSAKASKRRKT